MLPQWTVTTNYDLAELTERETVSIPLPLDNPSEVTTTVISGSLPRGLRLEDNVILGTPFEVARSTKNTFVIRAESDSGIRDRTFNIVVNGSDDPTWVTNEGRLPVGPNNVLFILETSLINYQLIATDNDLPAGETLKFYVQDGDGELPPGITLTDDGLLTGVVEPLIALDVNVINTGYDTTNYGRYPFDFAVPSDNGFSTFTYDTFGYDYSIPTRMPKKLNRYYEFFVTVADNVTSVKRKFIIYVVGDDYVRADNTLMKAADGVFTADATYLRTPLWLTPSYLGLRRANNFLTIYLDVLDQNTSPGEIRYFFESINDDGSPSVLPLGTQLDSITGEIAGIVPYQPAVTKEYKFTITAIRFDADMGIVQVVATINSDVLSGNKFIKIAKLPTGELDGIDDLNSLYGQEVAINNRVYTIISIDGSNEDYDLVELDSNLLPIQGISPLEVIKTAPGGQNYIWVKQLIESERDFYTNKTISFSALANHKIERINEYVEYQIDIADSTSSIEIVSDIIGTVDGSTDVEQSLEAYFGDAITPAYITTTSGVGGIKSVNMVIKSTSQNRNINFIKSIFHTNDSADVSVTRVADYDRVKIDTSLLNTLSIGRQITLGAVIGNSFSKTFARAENEAVEKSKTFTIRLLGEVDSSITWNTDSDLGLLKANRISTLSVNAATTIPNTVVKYRLTAGTLPPGLSLKDNGEIVGKVQIFGTAEQPGLTFFDNGTTTFDGGTTTSDRSYTFTIEARDRFGYSATTREFTLNISDSDKQIYSNLYFKPFLKEVQKTSVKTLLDDSKVFPPQLIYRSEDVNFGIQKELRSLVYAGIETKNISNYVQATAKNHKRKRYYFGDLKTAVAKNPGSNDIVYEVVYIELIDPLKSNKGKTKKVYNSTSNNNNLTVDSVKLESTNDTFSSIDNSPYRFRPNGNTITIDSNAVKIDQKGYSRHYISNIDNMRDNLSELGISSRDFLPLWMRTAQNGSLEELDYVLAVPLVYTIEGGSAIIKDNIIDYMNRTGFKFTSIDYDIDRYIIDATTGLSREQYIIFANYQFNV